MSEDAIEGGAAAATETPVIWMVHRGTGLDGVAGSLAIEGDALVFRPLEGGPPTWFPLRGIRHVRRVIGSPVLEIALRPGLEVPIVGFYFIRPPSLTGPDPSGRPVRRRTARKYAAVRLRTWNAIKRDEIRAWVRNIRSAMQQHAATR